MYHPTHPKLSLQRAQVHAVLDEQMRNLVQVQTGSRVIGDQAKEIISKAEKTMASLN